MSARSKMNMVKIVSSIQREEIIKFMRSSYDENARVPSVRDITDHFKNRLSITGFYKLFPDGLGEACQVAGIPIPAGRLEETSKAQATKEQNKTKITAERAANCFTLSKEQTERLYGIKQLEGGEDVSLIVDELLTRDSILRKKYNLSFVATKRVAEFLEKAVESGWSVSAEPNKPNLLEGVNKLWNIIIDQKLSLESINSWIQILKDLETHKWNPTEFVEEISHDRYALYWYYQYQMRKITLQEFIQKVTASQ
jgi:hypothetical protein